MAETIRESDKVKYISCDGLEETGLVEHGFMTRIGGISEGPYASLNLGFRRGDGDEKVTENFRLAAACFNTDISHMVTGHQTHTAVVRKVSADDAGKGVTVKRDYTDVDGLITNVPGLLLGTSHADCTPVFLLDPVHLAVGMVHSGWRGTVKRIGRNAVRMMTEEFGSDPEDILAFVGPCICKSCYEVGSEVAEEFAELSSYEPDILTQKPDGKYLLDLKAANALILKLSGLRDENITVSEHCTYEEEELFFSHRRMGAVRGQNMAFIGLKEQKRF